MTNDRRFRSPLQGSPSFPPPIYCRFFLKSYQVEMRKNIELCGKSWFGMSYSSDIRRCLMVDAHHSCAFWGNCPRLHQSPLQNNHHSQRGDMEKVDWARLDLINPFWFTLEKKIMFQKVMWISCSMAINFYGRELNWRFQCARGDFEYKVSDPFFFFRKRRCEEKLTCKGHRKTLEVFKLATVERA